MQEANQSARKTAGPGLPDEERKATGRQNAIDVPLDGRQGGQVSVREEGEPRTVLRLTAQTVGPERLSNPIGESIHIDLSLRVPGKAGAPSGGFQPLSPKMRSLHVITFPQDGSVSHGSVSEILFTPLSSCSTEQQSMRITFPRMKPRRSPAASIREGDDLVMRSTFIVSEAFRVRVTSTSIHCSVINTKKMVWTVEVARDYR